MALLLMRRLAANDSNGLIMTTTLKLIFQNEILLDHTHQTPDDKMMRNGWPYDCAVISSIDCLHKRNIVLATASGELSEPYKNRPAENYDENGEILHIVLSDNQAD